MEVVAAILVLWSLGECLLYWLEMRRDDTDRNRY